jgi:hypothetical protein
VVVFEQVPEQLVMPVGQTQAPAVQMVPPVQAFPQPPQLLTSVWRLTQVPEQVV